MQPVEIKKNIFWVGAVDWDIREFHGYSIPSGTTYNAFLIRDEKIALADTVKACYSQELLGRIKQLVDPEKIDYLIVNHVEMDHSGALPEIVDIVKPEKILCSANGKKAMIAHFHREDWPYEVVANGQEISLGEKTVRFIETKMLHWPDSMFSYIVEDKLLISQDAFGQHWATSERFDDQVDQSKLMYEAAKYYANILMLYSPLVRKLLENIKAMGLEVDMIAPDHGLIWRSNVGGIIEAWDRWSKGITTNKALVVYDTMWHSTEAMAHAVADGLSAEGVCVKVMSLQSSHRSDVVTELLDAKAMVLGSPTLNNGILPQMADLLCYVKGLRPTGKIGAAFGSYGWGGESIKLLTVALEEMKFQMADSGLRVNYVPTADDLAACTELGRKVAAAMNSASDQVNS
ncbi:MAG: flavodoxin domain-containing protein [Armatimonadota bacterium]|nr:flavodoxin domain-containing protein [bacterium]